MLKFKNLFIRHVRKSIALSGLFISLSAAADEPTRCYRFQIHDTPEKTDLISGVDSEIWCYQKLSQPAGSLFIYNADGKEVKRELALVVEEDGVITHGSLKAGKVSTFRTHAKEFNPFSVPLQEPAQRSQIQMSFTPELNQSASEVLNFLLSQRAPFVSMAVSPGRQEVNLPTSELPWKGYWWPYKNAPMYGTSQSPLAKYDRFVAARTGANPGAVAWEKDHHRYRGASWHGHCNGWAASSILRGEPRASRRDPVSGVTFQVSDIKGILAEKDYCATTSFFGKRYNGREGDDIKDIYPALFHKTLTYYIGQAQKAVVMDYQRGSSVDNHVVSGYKMNIRQSSANQYRVTATIKIHRYDKSKSNAPGIAPPYTRTYQYTLETDASGAITGGKWLSGNPDFLWVPLSSPECRRSNSKVTNQWTDEILALPLL